MELLRSLVAQVRQRDVVHHRWGFSRVGSRGLGTMALFWGSSGTGNRKRPRQRLRKCFAMRL